MRTTLAFSILFLSLLLSPGGTSVSAQSDEKPESQVRNAEMAFAKTMAARDYAKFASFISEEAIFSSNRGVLRGKEAVVQGWKEYFKGKQAPFSWEPVLVEVLDSGTLALSSGPVRDPEGHETGTFTSIWRREPDGKWRVVFDKGCPPCECSESK